MTGGHGKSSFTHAGRKHTKKYAAGGLETALHDRPRPGGARKLTPKGEATLIALACSDPPEERPSWTMQL